MDLSPNFRWYKVKLKDSNLKLVDFLFRGVTTKELRIAGLKPDKFSAENYILSRAVANPTDWEIALAGTSNKLLFEIYRVSGLDEEGLTFKEALDWLQSENGALEAAAVAMLPGVTLDLLENCDPFHYAKYLFMGKFQFENMSGIPVEQAFLGQPAEGQPNVSKVQADRAHLKSGERGFDIEQFSWKKGQPLDIPLEK
jgi:hypothetical protein